jgi:hypothetical protein
MTECGQAPGAPKRIAVVAPSVVGAGEPFAVGVRVLTDPRPAAGEAAWNRPTASPGSPFNRSPRGIRWLDDTADWTGELAVSLGDGMEGPAVLSFAPRRGSRRAVRRAEGFRCLAPGTGFISVRDPSSGAEGTSNPVEVTPAPPGERLFWGDLHVHTIFTDGLRCPEELYSFARDEAFLDVCALADHSEGLTDDQWRYFAAVTNRFDRPGRFATLVAGEWTSMKYGHRNYYYPGDDGPVLRSTEPPHDTLDGFFAAVRRAGGLAVPHHSANAVMGVDWSLGHDPEVERLAEIHSVWGSSERPGGEGNPFPIRAIGGEKVGRHVIDALRLGRRFGLIGSSDAHDGRPGDELHTLQEGVPDYPDLHGQGLVGVWAPELSRRAVFEALWNRRCYAATNRRTLLRFSLAGRPMGSFLEESGPLPVVVEAVAEVPIARVELVGNGACVRAEEPDRREVRLEFSLVVPPEGAWYYVRVTRRDGHLAWSSPIWAGSRERQKSRRKA